VFVISVAVFTESYDIPVVFVFNVFTCAVNAVKSVDVAKEFI
jgi:hypothetical protein